MNIRKIIKKRFSIRILVANMFLIAMTLTAVVGISLQYSNSKQMTVDHILSSINLITNQVGDSTNKLDHDARRTVSILANLISSDLSNKSTEEKSSLFSQFLKEQPNFYSLYIGDKREHFFQVINLNASPLIRKKLHARPEDRWAVIKVEDTYEGRQRETSFYSGTLAFHHKRVESTNFQPTERLWFDAANINGIYKTKPYTFQHLQITGQTYAERIRNTDQVLGLDILMSSVNEQLESSSKQINIDNVQTLLFRKNGRVIASSLKQAQAIETPDIPRLPLSKEATAKVNRLAPIKVSNKQDWRPFDFTQSGLAQGYFIDLMQRVSAMTGLEFKYINGFTHNELFNKYHNGEIDLLLGVQKPVPFPLTGLLSSELYTMPYAIATRKDTQLPSKLSQLDGKTLGYADGWSKLHDLKKQLPNINWQASQSVEELITKLENKQIDAIIGARPILISNIKNLGLYNIDVSNDVTHNAARIESHLYLLGHNNQAFIMNLINEALASITDEQYQSLEANWLAPNAPSHEDVPHVQIAKLTNFIDLPEEKPFSVYRSNDGVKYYIFTKSVSNVLADQQYLAILVPEHSLYKQAIKKAKQSAFYSALLMFLLTPIIWLFSSPIVRPIKQLQLETEKLKQRNFQDVALTNSKIKEVWQLSVSFKEMADEIKQHEINQKDFMESLIRLIANTIDEKSAHTAEHCHRVPELGLMLSRALEATQKPPFKDFQFANDDERREFRIAAWLHDCGKITTPEHIIDKGSKLECMYNRIHEIRTRFEVLLRDAHIDYLTSVHIEKNNAKTAMAQWLERQEQLHDEFAFIAKANIGSEFMTDEAVSRIHQIAAQEWTLHFNPYLGLSPGEEQALTNFYQQPFSELLDSKMPMRHPLLVDKKEHLIPRPHALNLDPKLGIKMAIPESQYNLGELYNLSIQRGTLTTEDRFKINEHIIGTIRMLDSLPFPPELSRVPHYASTHHERMDGQGYPRKLDASKLTIPDRVLMIADIFEALTSSDRPYKKAKPLSAALRIMFYMCKEGHLDKQLFEFFLESEVYLDYAKRFLPEAQIDDVDIKDYRFDDNTPS